MRWLPRSADESIVQNISRELNCSLIFARLLVARGLKTAEDADIFLDPSISKLHSPYLMKGMRVAVDRLKEAIANRERVLIYGDYDVDGTTAVVILKTVIELCGGITEFHVPHRIKEGYGMRDEVIQQAAASGVRLVISVDTGIRAFSAAEAAHQCGVDLIVTDHHLPEAIEGVPRALAVLNPNQLGCNYPCKALCGAGVAFKVSQALLEEFGRSRLLPSFVKMVAIATIADAVPLTGENRILAKLGLEGLRHPVNAGLKAILELAQLDGTRAINAGDIAFRIAPRLNAPGRMDVARTVIELFSAKDPIEAQEIAKRLNELNTDRQTEEHEILDLIHKRIAEDPSIHNASLMVVDGEGWHRGVIGITATRVVERYCRPAIVLSRDGDEAHGSGRSIRSFHLLEALESCRHLFTRFGGHSHAVGLALPCERIPELRSTLDAYARARLTEADFVPYLDFDQELDFDKIGIKLYEAIQKLQPFGIGNPEPVFTTRSAQLRLPAKVLKDKHLKLKLSQGTNGNVKTIAAMGWRMAENFASDPLVVGDSFDLAYNIDLNDHPDFGGLELRLCDIVRNRAATT